MQNKTKKPHISTPNLAKILGISRVAVFNRIKKGQIPAEKIGRSYAISMDDVNDIVHGTSAKTLTEEQKKNLTKVVAKVIDEYGDTLRLLGKE